MIPIDPPNLTPTLEMCVKTVRIKWYKGQLDLVLNKGEMYKTLEDAVLFPADTS